MQTSPAAAPSCFPASTSTGSSTDLASPEAVFSETSAKSYHEISWAAMFDHFLDGRRRDQKDTIDKCSITYLGESFPLAMVLEEFKEGGRPRLHHAGPPLMEEQARDEPTSETHPSHMLPEDIAFLQAKDAFVAPPQEILDALLANFLDRVWPIYPVVNRQEFLQQYKAKKVPWILMHALCYISATFCPLAILHRAGFTGRKQARVSYYRKAKALFDTGYESNKITILQSVIILTFWGGGPNNYWNFYSWISTGVTIAEALGIHRSIAGANMHPHDRSLLKRLWWILVIRDAQCGIIVGHPFRVNINHSDTEMLTVEDFENDIHCPDFVNHPLRDVCVQYQIHMSKLSLLLREIISTRFDPNRAHARMANLHDTLQEWRNALPSSLRCSANDKSSNPFATCLAVLYDHHLILSHLGRPTTGATITPGDTGSLSRTSSSRLITESAAQRISSLTCTFTRRNECLVMPHEVFQGLFLAQAVFYTQMKSPLPLVSQLGFQALNSCQMVWHDIYESWDAAPWISKLFDNLIGSRNQDESNEVDLLRKNMTGGGGPSLGNGMVLDGIDGYVNWQNHPTLGFFDMSQGEETFPLSTDYAMFPNYFGVGEPTSFLSW
ncbi:uncharacterized protein Z520_03462 [Fonsecaea multimorphosa CBS 102226]|uniref:Xylanolytic transcriptional activator regulatory domain-containing protein n=1 Tax=Fonsecaea multimorphosa CBS 102226 TaxID=1442371 RepID=A0A0D2HFW0_9EURO|nr:uncharacterized protein Z520_03462 [Fonsecaea multimorphosa CBS 102226]KIY00796.1 hypothetical protein Z520_03462 [Fonsecaea multimorphosa CBS 102226]OAL27895.1 hypothetical protein AYO22_03240 [Fonsecaea multimorphosa]